MHIEFYRSRLKKWGSAWTLFARAGRWFLEVNFGKDLRG